MITDVLFRPTSRASTSAAGASAQRASWIQQLLLFLLVGSLYQLTKAVHDPWEDIPLDYWASAHGLPKGLHGDWKAFAAHLLALASDAVHSWAKLSTAALHIMCCVAAKGAHTTLRSFTSTELPACIRCLLKQGAAAGSVRITGSAGTHVQSEHPKGFVVDASWMLVGVLCAHLLNSMPGLSSGSLPGAQVAFLLDFSHTATQCCREYVSLVCWLLLFEQVYVRLFGFIVRQIISTAFTLLTAAAGVASTVLKYVYNEQPFYGSLACIGMLNVAAVVQLFWLQS